jgi:protocatechuate 3,4-dioxygenase alpha subunit
MTKNNKIYFKTPSQTVGPFFGNYLNFNFGKKTNDNFNEKIDNKIILKINLKDKKRQKVKDAFIEYWQVLQNKNRLLYFDRINYSTKKKSYLISLNEYQSDTIIYVTIFARGLLNHLNTIIYLEDKNFYKKDHLYKKLPIERRKLMLAKLRKITNNIKYYEHDLYLSGIKEAVFFNFDN